MHLFNPSLLPCLFLFTCLSTTALATQPEHMLFERDASINDPNDHTPHPISPESQTSLVPRTPRSHLFPRAPWNHGYCISNSNAAYNCQVGTDLSDHSIPRGTCWDWRCALPRQEICACPPDGGRPNPLPWQYAPSSISTAPSSSRPAPRTRPRLPRLPRIGPPSIPMPRLHPRSPHPEPQAPPTLPPLRAQSPNNTPLPPVVLPGACDVAGPNCVIPPSRFTLMLTCQDWRCAVPGRRKCECALGAEGTRIHAGTELRGGGGSLRDRMGVQSKGGRAEGGRAGGIVRVEKPFEFGAQAVGTGT